MFSDLGPLKAQFSTKNSDMDAGIKLGAGLMLMLGLTLSGVKWNPINGKMAGFGCFITAGCTAYNQFKADGDTFVPHLFYVYAAIILIAGLHIFVFPSNPLPPKNPETKNNHGNLSDIIALGLVCAAFLSIVFPDHLYQEFGPMKPQFSNPSPDSKTIIKFNGCLLLTIALIFSGVKWNPVNGKMAGSGGFICAGYTAFSTFKADGNAFMPKIFYFYSAFIFFGALHIFAFPSNPLPPKPDAKEGAKKKK